jgi:hypothetical protein
VLVALVAVLALGAVAASGASAHEFRVEGKGVTGEEAFTGTGGTVRLVGSVGGVEFSINCEKSASTGDLLGGSELSGRVSIKRCAFTGLGGCSLTAAEETEMEFRLHGQLVGSTTPKVENKGTGGGEALFSFSLLKPAGCIIAEGVYWAYGHWTCELHEAGVEAVEHEEVCKKSESHLIAISEEKATLAYTEKIGLVSGKKWSAV